MKFLFGIMALTVGILVPGAAAAPPSTPAPRDLLVPIVEREEAAILPRQTSCHTPSNRACWTTGYNINTDYEVNSPNTGVVRPVSAPLHTKAEIEANMGQYTFTLTEEENWTGPDGVVKNKVMLINSMLCRFLNLLLLKLTDTFYRQDHGYVSFLLD
jgi:hypothetical protein